jgi:hypothetical protein
MVDQRQLSNPLICGSRSGLKDIAISRFLLLFIQYINVLKKEKKEEGSNLVEIFC